MPDLELDAANNAGPRALKGTDVPSGPGAVSPAMLWIAVVLASFAAFAAVVAARAAGGLTGWHSLLALGLVMVLTPAARNLSQRILFAVVGLAGTAPFMWWFSADIPYLDRGTVVLALGAAALVGSLTYTGVRRLPFRRFLPRFRAVDSLPLMAVVPAAWAVQNFLFTRTFESTLVVLTNSWDFAPHFNMFNMIRNHGSIIALLPSAPDGSKWTAASYPQGFHALLASLAEIVAGPEAGDVGGESMLFLRLVGVVTVLGTLLVVAGLTSLPAFRRNFLVTLPFVTIAATAWIVGPGAIPVFGAFPNFALAVALCVACIVIVEQRRITPPAVSTAALILTVTAVAHGWILLLVLCLPSVVVYGLFLLRHRREVGGALLLVQSALASVGAAGVVGALWQLRQLSAGEVLTATGGIALADPGVAVLCIVANALVALAFYSRRKVGPADVRRGTLASLHVLATPLFAAVLLVALAVFQLTQASKVSYYFHKSFLAVELLAIFCTVVAAAELWSPLLARHGHRKTFVAASLLAALGATQFFGLPFTGLSDQGLKPTAPGATGVLGQAELLSRPAPRLIRKLVGMAAIKNTRPFVYVGFDDGFDPQLAAQWSLALQGKWTESNHLAIPMVRPMYDGPSHVPEAIEGILRSLPGIDVVVDPELVPELRAWRPQYASRIITY
ncbi:hypothetical protein [Pseudarthrobacter albicanus]|uniref:hypothetical protein n=1 Tax=Pseudarthrobacter albicanus TaxID=2823873 RepID=UPI001BACBA3D|nr:hypothetical protein [Pseudarthrobacter albicanus]